MTDTHPYCTFSGIRAKITLKDYRIANDYDDALPAFDDDSPLVPRVGERRAIKETQLRRMLKWLFVSAAEALARRHDGRADYDVEEAVAALRQATPHWLRHTYATDQWDAGVDPRHIQANLGHTSMDTTLIYNHNDERARHDDTMKRSGLDPTGSMEGD